MADVTRDGNHVPGLIGTSNADGTPVAILADPVTGRLLVNSTGGSSSSSGTVQITAGTAIIGKVSVVDSNGADATDTGNQSVRVTVVSGSTGNAAAGATGSAVPAQGSYNAINVGGTLRGQTGLNPSGTVYVAQTDITTMNGVAVSMNNGTSDPGTQRVTLASDSTGRVALASGSNTVGTVTVNSLPSIVVSALPSIPAGSNTIGTVSITPNSSVDIAQVGGTATSVNNGTVDAGTQRVTLASDSSGQVKLAAGSNLVGTVTVQQSVAANLNAQAVGNAAHAATDSGNPIKTGARATATLSTVTLVAATQRTDNMADLDGALIVRSQATLGDYVTGTATISTKTATQVIASQGSGVRCYLTAVTISNSGTTSVDVELQSGTTRWILPAPCGTAGINLGGVTHNFGVYGLPGTAATAWNFLPSATTTLKVSALGFRTKI